MYPICSFKGKTEAAQNKQEKLVQPEVGVGNKYRLAALVKKNSVRWWKTQETLYCFKKTLTFCFRTFNPNDSRANCHEQEAYSSSKEKKGWFRSDQGEKKPQIFNKVVIKIAKIMHLNLISQRNEIYILFYSFLIVDIERKRTCSKIMATN